MSRDTIFSAPPPKCLTGEDRLSKPKHVTHLATFPNFFNSDQDHSLGRPQGRKKQPHDRDLQCNDLQQGPSCRKSIQPNCQLTSSYDILAFDPNYAARSPRTRWPQGGGSTLTSAGQPQLYEVQRLSKRAAPRRYDSQGVKTSLTHQ